VVLKLNCNGLTFDRASESPGSDLDRRTPDQMKKRGFKIKQEVVYSMR